MPAWTALGAKSRTSVAGRSGRSSPVRPVAPQPTVNRRIAASMAAPAARLTLRAMQAKGPAAYFAELIGTFLLVLFIGFILASNSPAEAGGLGFTDFAVIGLLHAFVLMMLVATLGGTSGAHFNPAVTVTLGA